MVRSGRRFSPIASIDLSFDLRVLLFTAVIALLTGVLFGLAPAIHVARANLNETLEIGARRSGSATTNLTRSALVVSELAWRRWR